MKDVPEDPLLTYKGRNWLINQIFEAPPEAIGTTCNIQLLNLLCAADIPGSENLDLRKCLAKIDQLAEYIKGSVERSWNAYGPAEQYGFSEAKTRMGFLVTRMKREYGAAYSPQAKADLDAGIDAPFSDTSEVFVHGLLHDDPKRRWGTCASLPVLATVIARRLGYPVKLAMGRCHLYARWEAPGECFNIEVSNPAGMSTLPDDHYREMRGGFPPELLKSGYHFRSLTPAEEFAEFIRCRLWCLRDAARYDETFLWSARALMFAPDDPTLPHLAYLNADLGLKSRLRIKHPEIKIPPADHPDPFYYKVGDITTEHELPFIMTVAAHYRESIGEMDTARLEYENAARHSFDGTAEQRDLQRFVRKHGLKPKEGLLMPPKNPGVPRRFKLMCRAQDEAVTLKQMAKDFERNGELVKARDALHDLYMFDPCDAELFEKTRELQRRPLFAKQFSALLAEAKRRIEKKKLLESLGISTDASGIKQK